MLQFWNPCISQMLLALEVSEVISVWSVQNNYKGLNFQKLSQHLWKKSHPFKTKMPQLPSSLEIHTHENTTPIQEETKDKPKTLQVVYGGVVQEGQGGIRYDILMDWQVHTLLVTLVHTGGLRHLFSENKVLRDLKSSVALHSPRASRIQKSRKCTNLSSRIQMTPSWCLLRLDHSAKRLEAAFSKSNF